MYVYERIIFTVDLLNYFYNPPIFFYSFAYKDENLEPLLL